MNFIPSIISLLILTLLSLNVLIFCTVYPFFFPINIWNGISTIITHAFKIPGQPNLVTKIAIIPHSPNGATREVKNKGPFVSMALKSLESKFIIFPIYWFLIVYCDNLESLQFTININ